LGIKRALTRLVEPIVEVTDYLDNKMSVFIQEKMVLSERRISSIETAILKNGRYTMRTRFDELDDQILKMRKKLEVKCDHLQSLCSKKTLELK